MFAVFALICVGLLGAGLFASGIVFSMTALTVPGIVLLALAVVSMVLWHVYKTPQDQNLIQTERQVPAAAYTTNNMNTIKRNKSDTDLELIGSQGPSAARASD